MFSAVKSSTPSMTGMSFWSASREVWGVVFIFLLTYMSMEYSGISSIKSTRSGISLKTSVLGCNPAQRSGRSISVRLQVWRIHGSAYSTNFSRGRLRIYTALMAVSLSGSNIAGDLEIPDRSNASIISSSVNISCSPLGAQPSNRM